MSKVGFSKLLQAVGRAFQLEGHGKMPSEVDESSIKMVGLLDPGMMGLEQFQLFGAAINLEGIASAVWTPVGTPQDVVGFAATNRFENNGDKEVVILGMRCRVIYTAGGLVAPERFSLTFLRQAAGNPISSVEESTFDTWRVTRTGEVIYDWSFPWHQNSLTVGADPPEYLRGGNIMSMPYIYVPAGSAFRVSLVKEAGAVWPAGVDWRCTAFGVACPKGTRPPGM